MRSSPAVIGACALALVILLGADAGAATADAQWGFDGTVVAGVPNLLTVTVDNNGAEPIEGTLVLQEGGAVFAQSGAPYVAQIFVGPRSARSVQFAPWIGRDSKWTLSGTVLDGREVVLDEPRVSAPGRVLIAAQDTLGSPRNGLALFAEERFPDTVALCDALGEAVIDHQPRRWSPQQRQALRDWVAGGGTLDVLKGADGQYPAFTGELAPLASADGVYGQGKVVRLDTTLAAPPAEWHYRSADDEDDHGDRRIQHRQERGSLEDTAKQDFQGLVRPHLPWAMINLLLLVFLGVVGFGPLVASRRGVDWRWVNAGVVVAIVLCCLAVVALGRRGYGESSQLRALALARWIDGTTYDVTVQANLFVIASGQYGIAHGGKPNLYGTGEESDPGTAIAVGEGSSFQPVVPLFSNCPFHVRLRADLDCPPPVPDPGHHAMTIDLPAGSAVAAACLAHAGSITTLEVSSAGGKATLVNPGSGVPFDDYGDRYGNGYGNFGQELDRDRVFKDLFTAAVREDCLRTGADLDPNTVKKVGGKTSPVPAVPSTAAADADAARPASGTWVYVLVMDLPKALQATTATPLAQDGAVVYCFPWSEAP